MSSVTINGKLIFRTSASVESPAPAVEPSWATHRMVDGQWILKGESAPAREPKRIIGFKGQTPTSNVAIPEDQRSAYGLNKAELRSRINKAIGKIRLFGTNDQEVLAMVDRGRRGSRNDTKVTLISLLDRYESAVARRA